jgi:hypothetical protein
VAVSLRYWRGVFARTEAKIVPGSWDVAGLRGTGSFDWTVEDVFLPERRTMPQVGIPLENQWSRWPVLRISCRFSAGSGRTTAR